MMYIKKTVDQPLVIQDFYNQQMSARQQECNWKAFPVDYSSFPDTTTLKQILLEEQGGLCAYTGVAIDDERLPEKYPRNKVPPVHSHWYTSHIEHLKPQSVCQNELKLAGKIPGKDWGDDLNYHNMVAAIEVGGIKTEHFGAVLRQNNPLEFFPTTPNCEQKFHFDAFGSISGIDTEADSVIKTLDLNHDTLKGWREEVIDVFLPYDLEDVSKEELVSYYQSVVENIDKFDNKGQLTEFCFAVKSIAQQELNLVEELEGSLSYLKIDLSLNEIEAEQ